VALHDADAVVVGAGPNGLVAGCVLARAGLSVLVLEADPERAGGAVRSLALTRPGFVHDVGAAFFPFARRSPAFVDLDLPGHGLSWRNAPVESAHPAPDGSVAVLARDPELSARNFGLPRDGERWRAIAAWHDRIEPRLLRAMLSPFPSFGALLRLSPLDLLRLSRIFLASGRRLSTRLFRSDAAQRVLPSLALHTDVGPDDTFGSGIGYVLAATATTGGYAVPAGGAGRIADTLLNILRGFGGNVRLGARVVRIVVRDRRARGVVLADGEEIACRCVLANTSAPALFLDLIEAAQLPGRVVRRMRTFPHGWGTFKLDWALSGPVPWTVALARQSAVVHAADSLDDLARFTAQVRRGELPEHPYLVIGQQSLCDETRAPPGSHTLWAYSRVPPRPAGGWAAAAERFADAVDLRIEGLAPGFRALVLERRIHTPDDLQRIDANLVGGDLGGGSNAWHRQLLFRPLFPYFRHRMPVAGLYLCSSYAHPGAGVHGMCGYNAAWTALEDLG
jgi:phytoene dehydrogenase-like protein